LINLKKGKIKMPKAILEFDLPEEEKEFRETIDVGNLKSALWDFSQDLRAWTKHGHTFKNADEALEQIRDKFWEHLTNHNVEID
jgi:hypothetical protein